MNVRVRLIALMALVTIARGVALAQSPVAVAGDVPLEANDQTLGLWRLDAGDGDRIPNTVGGGPDAQLVGDHNLVDPPRGLHGFERVAKLNDRRAALVISNDFDHLSQGPFTVEVRASMPEVLHKKPLLRFGDLQLLLTLRQAGTMTISGHVKTMSGKTEQFALINELLFKHVGRERLRVNEFHHYALTYDGTRRLRLYIDGFEAWSAELPQQAEQLVIGADRKVEVGGFSGLLAEVRLSAVERHFEPIRFLPQSLSEMAPRYRFDMGGPDTPIQDGCIAVTPDHAWAQGAEFGWSPAPIGSHDAWFTGLGFSHHNEVETNPGAWGVRSWLERDGVTVQSGSTFRAAIPPGRYEVRVNLGHMRLDNLTRSVVVNGKSLGDHMKRRPSEAEFGPIITVNESYDPVRGESKTVRGVVDIGDDGLKVQLEGWEDRPVHVLAIEAFPWQEPIVQRRDGTLDLVWSGDGPAPDGFDEASAAYSELDLEQAAKLAERIDDPLARCSMWAWILGYPESATDRHVALTERLLRELGEYVDEHPEDVQAASLMRATELFYPAVLIQVEGGRAPHKTSDIVGSHTMRLLDEAVQFSDQILESEPYFGQARLIAGQSLYTMVDQGGGYLGPYTFGRADQHPEKVPPIVPLMAAAEAYPQSRLPGIYMGNRVPAPGEIEIPANAPRWAELQHVALVRMLQIIHHWVDVRQDDRGLMGGGINDDVEALRRWSLPVLVADDEGVRNGWRLLAETAWQYMGEQPYPSQMRDVEHNAETFADTHTFYPFIEFGTSRFDTVMQRAEGLYPLMAERWTGRTPDGHLMFRSLYYSREQVREDGSGDHFYQFRAVKPLMVYQWFTGDEQVKSIMLDWADSWHAAILEEKDGKPAGIVPIRITYPDRRFTVQGHSWYEPNYFKYPDLRIYQLLVMAFEMSGDAKYLQPITVALTAMRDADFPTFDEAGWKQQSLIYRQADDKTQAQQSFEAGLETGSLRWALWEGRREIGTAGAMYRAMTSDRSFDDVLARYAPATTRARIAMDRAKSAEQRADAARLLETELEKIADGVSFSIEMFTSEVKSTDRIRFHGDDMLLSMACGQLVSDIVPPMLGVSWKETGSDLAVFLTDTTDRELSGYLYSFADQDRSFGALVWQLEPGEYELIVTASDGFETDGEVLSRSRIELTQRRGQRIDIEVPAQRQVRFSVVPTSDTTR